MGRHKPREEGRETLWQQGAPLSKARKPGPRGCSSSGGQQGEHSIGSTKVLEVLRQTLGGQGSGPFRRQEQVPAQITRQLGVPAGALPTKHSRKLTTHISHRLAERSYRDGDESYWLVPFLLSTSFNPALIQSSSDSVIQWRSQYPQQ